MHLELGQRRSRHLVEYVMLKLGSGPRKQKEQIMILGSSTIRFRTYYGLRDPSSTNGDFLLSVQMVPLETAQKLKDNESHKWDGLCHSLK